MTLIPILINFIFGSFSARFIPKLLQSSGNTGPRAKAASLSLLCTRLLVLFYNLACLQEAEVAALWPALSGSTQSFWTNGKARSALADQSEPACSSHNPASMRWRIVLRGQELHTHSGAWREHALLITILDKGPNYWGELLVWILGDIYICKAENCLSFRVFGCFSRNNHWKFWKKLIQVTPLYIHPGVLEAYSIWPPRSLEAN